VGPGLGAFFEHDDRNLGALFCGQLFEPDGRRQSSRATADDDDVVFHRFAGSELNQYFLIGHDGGEVADNEIQGFLVLARVH
jgi:hypothetical protein